MLISKLLIFLVVLCFICKICFCKIGFVFGWELGPSWVYTWFYVSPYLNRIIELKVGRGDLPWNDSTHDSSLISKEVWAGEKQEENDRSNGKAQSASELDFSRQSQEGGCLEELWSYVLWFAQFGLFYYT